MVLTIDFIRENFHKFNKEYFGGSLVTPEFKITTRKRQLGCMSWNFKGYKRLYTICISNYYDRCKTDYQNTIIHEMIHLYIRQNDIKDTRRHHGKVFYDWADKINKQGGWHIARTDDISGCGLTEKSNNTYYVVIYKTSVLNKYFMFCLNKNYVKNYDFKSMECCLAFTSHNDKAFAKYPLCRTSRRGWFITEKEFLNAYQDYGETIIYSSHFWNDRLKKSA